MPTIRLTIAVLLFTVPATLCAAPVIGLSWWIDTSPHSMRMSPRPLFETRLQDGVVVRSVGNELTDIHSTAVETFATRNRFRFTGSLRLDSDRGEIGVTFGSRVPFHEEFYRLRLSRGNCFLDSTTSDVTVAAPNPTATIAREMWHRFIIDFNTARTPQVMVKVWLESADEPGEWNRTVSSVSLASGFTGCFGCWASGGGLKSWKDLRVDGVALPVGAPAPVRMLAEQTVVSVGDPLIIALVGRSPKASRPRFEVTDPSLVETNEAGQLIAKKAGVVGVFALYESRRLGPVWIKIDPSQRSDASQTADHVKRGEFTWRFAKSHPVGQFVNGDPWVVGPVHVVAIEPATAMNGDRMLNGSMKDPRAGTTMQGWDSLMYGFKYSKTRFDADLNVGKDLSAQAPLILEGPCSLVSVTSRYDLAEAPPTLLSAAVLTVLSEAPRVGAFRPPYIRCDKSTYYLGQVRTEKLLNLREAPGAPSFDLLKQSIAAPWLDHVPGWLGRFVHPERNMPDYGRDVSALLGTVSLRLNTDAPLEDKMGLLIAFLQIGIDLDAALQSGSGWPSDGGHSIGRKWPILFKRFIFGESIWIDRSVVLFSEDDSTFFVKSFNGEVNRGLGGYGSEQVGVPEWADRNWSDRPPGRQSDVDWGANPYRRCCTFNSLGGHYLSSLALGLSAEWQWDVGFAYMDRYMTVEHGWSRQWDNWTAAMWDMHR